MEILYQAGEPGYGESSVEGETLAHLQSQRHSGDGARSRRHRKGSFMSDR